MSREENVHLAKRTKIVTSSQSNSFKKQNTSKMSREENVHLAKRARIVTSSQSDSVKKQIMSQMSPEQLVYLAKQARKVDRYKDMVELMEMVVELYVGLTKEETMLLSVAYTDVINANVSSLTRLDFDELEEESRGNEDRLSIIRGYMGMIEFEITKQCILLIKKTGNMSREMNVLSILGEWLMNVTPSQSISSVNQNSRKMSREEIVYRAKLAMIAKRYDDVVELMKQVVETLADDFEKWTEDERKILFKAYQYVMNPSLESLRGLSYIEQKEEKLGNENHVSLINCYKRMMDSDLTKHCDVILDLIEPYAPSLVYLRMKGDYFESLAQFRTGAERDVAYQNSELAYKTAWEITEAHMQTLPPLPPLDGPILQITFSEAIEEFCSLNQRYCKGIPEAELDYKDNRLGESH